MVLLVTALPERRITMNTITKLLVLANVILMFIRMVTADDLIYNYIFLATMAILINSQVKEEAE